MAQNSYTWAYNDIIYIYITLYFVTLVIGIIWNYNSTFITVKGHEGSGQSLTLEATPQFFWLPSFRKLDKT